MASSTTDSTLNAAKSGLKGAAETAKRNLPSTAPPMDAYLAWNAPYVETVQADEERKAAEIAAMMNRMQQHNFDHHRHAFRATHVKTQSVVKGTLKVPSDLPPHLRQGLFAHEGTYPLVARYANEPVWLQPDTAPGPKGMGMKVFDVQGKRIDTPGNETLNTHDFLLNNAPMLELTDIDTCLDIMRLREKYFDSPTKLSVANTARTDAMKQNAPFMLPSTNIISMPMYTQSAFRFGEYYGHIGLFPSTEEMKSQTQSVPSDASPATLSDWLVEYFKTHDAVYDMRVQLGTDPVHHPTEDASVVWDENTAPWQTLGTVTFPKQDGTMKPQRRTFWEEHLRLNPWKGLEAHRPLGSVNRLRNHVYRQSEKERTKLNAVESTDVTSVKQIP